MRFTPEELTKRVSRYFPTPEDMNAYFQEIYAHIDNPFPNPHNEDPTWPMYREFVREYPVRQSLRDLILLYNYMVDVVRAPERDGYKVVSLDQPFAHRLLIAVYAIWKLRQSMKGRAIIRQLLAVPIFNKRSRRRANEFLQKILDVMKQSLDKGIEYRPRSADEEGKS
jgi:hypothetical protein